MTTITRSRHTLNVPVFVGTVVTLVLLAPVLYAWRNFQAQRTADSFLDYATQAEEAQDFRKASSYLQRYLVLKPDTAEAWVRLAETYDKSAVSARDQKRAVSLYFRALGMAEQQDIPRLRQRLGQLLLNEQRFADVRAEAQALIDGNEASGWRLMAFALFGQFQSGALAVNRGDPQAITVGEAAQKAVDHDPRDIEMSGLLARVYRDHPELLSEQQTVGLTSASRAEKADAVMNAVVAANDQNATALLARFQYRDFYGQADARQDLNQALEIGPDDPAVLLVAAEHARKTGDSLRQINLFSSRVLSPNDATAESPGTPTDTQTLDIPEAARQAYDEARKHYEHLLEVGRRGNLNLEQAYAGLGDVFFAEGDIDQAIQIWRKGLQVGAGDVNFALKARLAEAFVRQNNMAEADTALAALDSAFNTIAPSLPRSTKLANQQVIDLIRAQRYVRDRQFATAIPLLRRVTSSGVEDKNQAASNQYLQSLWLLANVYAAIGQWDQSAAVYQQVATLRPNEVVAQEATANSWMSASRPDLAVPYFQRALSLRNSPSLWLDLALAEFQQQVRAPMGQRNWEAFQHALTQAEQRDENGNLYLADPWRAVLLRADFENAQAALPTTGNPLGDREAGIARALERYRAAEAEYPQAAEMFRRLAFIYEELGQSQDADRALSAFAQLANDEVAVCLVRAGLLAKRQQYDAARTDLENTIRSTSDKNSQARLQSALAQVLVEQGAFGEAEKSIRKVHDLSTGRTTLNVRTLQQLADLAWEARDLEKLAELESQLQGREGASGSNWRYYRAQRLLHESQDINDSQFREAVELATWLLGQRPAWSPVHVLLANIEQRRGGIPQAIGHYQNAIRLGSNQLSVYERLVYLLSVSNRFAEAEDYLSRLQRFDSSSLDALEISIAARQGQTSRAVELARRHLQRNTNDVMAYIWLGQMLTLDGQIEAAETELKKATTYVPDDARTWLALFGFYVRTQQVELAEKSLQSLIANVALGDLDRTFLLAQGYELLKQDSTAEAYYIQSQKLAPDNPKVLSRLGGFYLSRDANKAIDILERLMRVAPQSDAERRSLAALLAKRGKANDFARALELLETTGQATDGNAVDQRLQAIFLSRRGGLNNIKKAQTILQNLLLHATTPVDSDRVLLARSYLLEREYLPADDVNRDRTLRLAQEQYVSLAGVD
jgi:tetratricopeptide (TPR) repeat protein